MNKKSTSSQRRFKKRLKLVAKSKARRAELTKKQKQKAEFIAKEVKALRKKREKEFFRCLEQKKLLRKLKLSNQSDAIDQIHALPQRTEIITKTKDDTESVEKNITTNENVKERSVDAALVNQACFHFDVISSTGNCHVVSLESRDVSSNLVALKLDDEEPVKFHGYAKLTILRGTCLINGYKMILGDAQLVFAPVTHPAMVIKLSNEDRNETTSNKETNFDFNALPEAVENYEVVILFQSLNAEDMPGTFPGYESIYDLQSLSITPKQRMCSTCWQCDTSRCFTEHDFYKQAYHRLASYKPAPCISNGVKPHEHLVAVTVGGKNVGKSTLNRYLINRLLERYPYVYYFECDVGQTEFTPSGFLSIHKIQRSNPLLGTPFTHQLMPEFCCFYGNNSPEGNPTRYVQCIDFLYQAVRRDGALDAPLIINTMGWIRDLGLLLLIDIIRLVSPTHILQFESPKSKHNLHHLTKSCIDESDGWSYNSSHRILPFQLVLLNLSDVYRHQGKYKASDNRILSLLSYIDNLSKRCHSQQGLPLKKLSLRDSVQAVNPYCVSVSQVALCNAQDRACKLKFALALFNASPVALCVAPNEIVEKLANLSEDDDIPEPPVCPCIGMGIVRGVDVKNNIAYIVSDLSLSEIEKVNCVIRGDLVLPESFLTNNEKIKPIRNQPYISSSFPFNTVGSNSFRSYTRMNANLNVSAK